MYVVSTAHVSSESCQEVKAVINFLKPEVVFLELCSGRVGILTPQNLKVPTMGECFNWHAERIEKKNGKRGGAFHFCQWVEILFTCIHILKC